MKALKITGCYDSQMWYREHVGNIVPLLQKGDTEHLSREPAGYTNIVLVRDCEIVDVDSLSEVSFSRPHDDRYR